MERRVGGRDPWGSVVKEGGQWYRWFSAEGRKAYRESYSFQRRLAGEGLWLLADAVEEGERVRLPSLTFVSYPWEWAWSYWQEAALTTLRIQREALEEGWILRDATPLNLTREAGRMVWFDQLSLGRYEEGQAWGAYPEFVGTFLAPILLMAWRDRRLGRLLQLYPQGLPLDMVYELLPWLRRWHPTALLHLRLALRKGGKSLGGADRQKAPLLPKARLLSLAESLEADIALLSPRYVSTPWEGYEGERCPYTERAQLHKKQTVDRWLRQILPRSAADIGAHIGTYTRVLAEVVSEKVIAIEQDAQAVDTLAKTVSLPQVYPLWADIALPSPPVWVGGAPLPGLWERLQGSVQLVLALAVVHHLRLRSYVSFAGQAELFAHLLGPGGYLIVEYIPPSDPQVRWLHSQPELFPDYSEEGFLGAMGKLFRVEAEEPLPESVRKLYLFRRR